MTIHMNLGQDSYDIVVERGLLAKANKYLNLNRRALIVTDTGVPDSYSKSIAGQCKDSVICTVESGEASKSMDMFGKLLQTMLDHGFSRKDCVIAVGGGVVGASRCATARARNAIYLCLARGDRLWGVDGSPSAVLHPVALGRDGGSLR